MKSTELSTALGHFQAAVRLDPIRLISLNAKVGEALWRLGRPQEAVQVCEAAIQTMEARGGDPRLGAAYRCLGDARMEQGNPSEAVRALQQAVSLGGDASGYSNLGGALRAVGKLQEARDALQIATNLEPGGTPMGPTQLSSC